jgi:hypothetical protein
MSIIVTKYTQDTRTYSSTSTLQRTTNVCVLKTKIIVWIMVVIEEGLTRV